MVTNLSVCQEWIRVFGPPNYGQSSSIVESYDKGYLVGGNLRHNNYSWHFGWLLKTDINGELLWEKKFGDETGSFSSYISGMEQTNDDGLIICGITHPFNNADGFVMKLDACGQKEWCNIYKSPGQIDYASHIHIIPGGGYIVRFAYWGYDYGDKRIWLFKLDEEGNTVWQNLYATDTSYINEEVYDMIVTPDSGYLITGYCDMEIDTMPGNYYWHPFFIKVNKNGDEEWEHTYWPEYGFGDGVAISSVCDNYGNIYATGCRGYSDEPALIKLDKDGEPLFHIILTNGTDWSIAGTVNFLADSTLVMGGYHSGEPGYGASKTWKVDTLGNILLVKDSLLLNVSYPKDATVTFDNKIVFVETAPYLDPGIFNIVMYKLNSDLEWDSLYTQPFEYDYLCEEPIVSDTIDMDCDIITDIEEQINNPTPKLKIWPNPATKKVVVELPEYYKTEISKNGIHSAKIRYLKEMKKQLEVYDIMGRMVKRKDISKGEMEVEIDVSGWDKGLYFLKVSAGNIEIATGKLLVN